MAGGITGILIGRASSFVITNTLRWPARLSPNSVFLAFGFAVSVGAFFGFYPAYKASRLDPVEALRFET